MAFVQRLISITIRLADDAPRFKETGSNTVAISGLRTSAKIQNSGSPGGSTMQLTVFGMTLSLMNQLATLGMIVNLIPKNTITVTAGDAETGQTIVFSGTITDAYGDFSDQPEVPFHFSCNSGLANAVIAVPASSFTGSTDVSAIMLGLANLMGLGFENSGVSAKLSNPYLWGSARDQYLAVAEHARINAEIINGTTLAIWPRGGARKGKVPLISPSTGMRGYPAYTAQGIAVQTVFNPEVGFGGQIEVQSQLTPACGIWNVTKLDHDLESMMPGGSWFSSIFGYNPKYPQPVPPP